MTKFEVIVLGCGGVGSAALFELAKRNVPALGIEQFEAAHHRGSSHGDTRIIRRAYFEHPNYVPLLQHAFRGWADLEARAKTQLFVQTGLLQVGPEDGPVISGVLASSQLHGLHVQQLPAAQASSKFPGLVIPEDCTTVYEPGAGYLKVEACVQAHLQLAVQLGARLHTHETVQSVTLGDPLSVWTDKGTYHASKLIVTAGAWTGSLAQDLPLSVTLEVRRKPQYWFATQSPHYEVSRGCPAYLFELPEGVFYGFPVVVPGTVKVAQHTGGTVLAHPSQNSDVMDMADLASVQHFVRRHLPGVGQECVRHAPCMYTMSCDEHFYLDRHPDHPQVAICCGLSGHGFKFANVLGQALADLAMDGQTSLPVGFLGFARGRMG